MQNSLHAYDDLLKALGGKLGLILSFDEDSGACTLQIGDKLTLNIHKFEDEGRLALSTVVADDLPDDLPQGIMTELMELALNPLLRTGPAIGREPQSGMLVMYNSVYLSDIEETDFPEIVQQFLELAVYWSEHINSEGTIEQNSVNQIADTSLSV